MLFSSFFPVFFFLVSKQKFIGLSAITSACDIGKLYAYKNNNTMCILIKIKYIKFIFHITTHHHRTTSLYCVSHHYYDDDLIIIIFNVNYVLISSLKRTSLPQSFTLLCMYSVHVTVHVTVNNNTSTDTTNKMNVQIICGKKGGNANLA